jgi:hypothetical protein
VILSNAPLRNIFYAGCGRSCYGDGAPKFDFLAVHDVTVKNRKLQAAQSGQTKSGAPFMALS